MRAQGLNSRGKPLKTNAAKVVTSKPAMPVIDAALPRDTILKAGPAELATVRAKLAAARGWVITKTSGQLDVIGREAFEARHASTKEMMTAAKPPAPPPALRSMFACGGTAGKGLVPMGRAIRLRQTSPPVSSIAMKPCWAHWRSEPTIKAARLPSRIGGSPGLRSATVNAVG